MRKIQIMIVALLASAPAIGATLEVGPGARIEGPVTFKDDSGRVIFEAKKGASVVAGPIEAPAYSASSGCSSYSMYNGTWRCNQIIDAAPGK